MFFSDTNADSTVDLKYLALVDNDSNHFVKGYVPTDINSNSSVDALDMNIEDNNAYNFVGTVTPTTLHKPTKEQKVLTQEQQD